MPGVLFIPGPVSPDKTAIISASLNLKRQIGTLSLPWVGKLPAVKLSEKSYLIESKAPAMITIERLYGIKIHDLKREDDLKWVSKGVLPQRWA
jgi:hypothetical protein